MELPLDHDCDGLCDPDDEDHRALRKERHRRSLIKADFKADQAWARARDMMPQMVRARKKLDSHAPLIQEDLDAMATALSLVLGELYLRQARTY